MKRFIAAIALVTALCLSAYAQSKKAIEGVWKISQVTTTGPGAATRQATQPSMYLFTKKHYSIIYVSSDAPREVMEDYGKASMDELAAIFVRDFVANAGTYDVKDGKVTFHPTVAKSPNYMQPGVFSTFKITMSGDSMTLVSDSSNNGPSKNPSTVVLSRVE